jgi:hypothetical protein
MSRFIVLSLGVLIGLLILLTAAAAPAMDSNGAESEPESFEVSGKTCIYFRGQLDCFCPCESGQCEANVITIPETRVITIPQPITVTVVETVPVPVQIAPGAEEALAPVGSPVGSTGPAGDEHGAPVRWDPYAPVTGVEPIPGQEWNPVNMPILVPGQTESPGEDDNPGNGQGPDPDKQFCNQGVGNGAEGCDPGNSNNNQDSNDEDGGVPGAPGRAHNDNGGGNSGGNSDNNGRGHGD